MIRPAFIELVLFATPFLLYALFLWATKAGIMDAESWPVSRLIWLAIVACGLVIGSFVYFANFSGAVLDGTQGRRGGYAWWHRDLWIIRVVGMLLCE